MFRARDTKLNRDVAIKILPDVFAHDSERVTRFSREAQTLASLNHPNIAQISGVIEESQNGAHVHALAMELVEGDDLSALVARGAIPLAEALPIARQIAEAALATLIAGGTAVLRTGPSATPNGSFHLDVVLPPGVEPASNVGLGMAISPDGRTAAMIGIRNGVRRVFLRRLDSTETTEPGAERIEAVDGWPMVALPIERVRPDGSLRPALSLPRSALADLRERRHPWPLGPRRRGALPKPPAAAPPAGCSTARPISSTIGSTATACRRMASGS